MDSPGRPRAPLPTRTPVRFSPSRIGLPTAAPGPMAIDERPADGLRHEHDAARDADCRTDTACDDGSCASRARTTYVPWWHRRFVWSYWKCHGLPSPWCPPGNLTLHIPTARAGSTYYYFRPYNWFHISDQQAEAANYNGDPRNPYDNRVVFDGLYDGL